jgi:hypothetical protein
MLAVSITWNAYYSKAQLAQSEQMDEKFAERKKPNSQARGSTD